MIGSLLSRIRLSERGGGALSVPIAVGLVSLLAVAGLAVDGVRAGQSSATADAIAQEAARAAGQGIDPAALRRGVARLDPGLAVAHAEAYLRAVGVEGSAAAIGPDRVRVTVTVRISTVLLGAIGIDEITEHGSADAVLVPIADNGPL